MVRLKRVLNDFEKLDAFVMVTDIFGVSATQDKDSATFYRATGMKDALDSNYLNIPVVAIQPHNIKIDNVIDTIAYIITINTEIED